MLAIMNKVRLVIQVDDEARDALKLESAISGEDMGDIVQRLIHENLPEAVEQIRTRRAIQEKQKNKDKDKK